MKQKKKEIKKEKNRKFNRLYKMSSSLRMKEEALGHNCFN